MKYRFKFKGWKEFQKRMKEVVPQMQIAVDRAVGKIAQMVRNEAIENLDRNKTNNTGDLRKSIIAQRIVPGVWLVQVGEFYGIFVEKGTKAHFPPVEEIYKWAKRKLSLSEAEARRVAWAIARHIASNGTKAQPFFYPAIDKVTPLLPAEIERAVKDVLKG